METWIYDETFRGWRFVISGVRGEIYQTAALVNRDNKMAEQALRDAKSGRIVRLRKALIETEPGVFTLPAGA